MRLDQISFSPTPPNATPRNAISRGFFSLAIRHLGLTPNSPGGLGPGQVKPLLHLYAGLGKNDEPDSRTGVGDRRQVGQSSIKINVFLQVLVRMNKRLLGSGLGENNEGSDMGEFKCCILA